MRPINNQGSRKLELRAVSETTANARADMKMKEPICVKRCSLVMNIRIARLKLQKRELSGGPYAVDMIAAGNYMGQGVRDLKPTSILHSWRKIL